MLKRLTARAALSSSLLLACTMLATAPAQAQPLAVQAEAAQAAPAPASSWLFEPTRFASAAPDLRSY